jgi:hypothetical protein
MGGGKKGLYWDIQKCFRIYDERKKKWMSDYSWQLTEDRKILKQQIIKKSNGERKQVLAVQYHDMRQKKKCV